MLIEVCAGSLQSAINAQSGGAKRVELCDNLYEGGTTPGPGTIELAREMLTIGLHVLIRPRGGDFLYSKTEYETIKRDIFFCKNLGCDGVVIGFLNADGTIDTRRTLEALELARPMRVTFHRAFDMTVEPFGALDMLIEMGIDRLLTSGQRNKAIEGVDLISNLVKRAGNNLVVMPGSGINEENIKWIQKTTGAKEFHLSGQKPIQSRMQFRKEGIFLGGLPQIPEYEIAETDSEVIKRVVEILYKIESSE
jgi:copper homeostasis protein